MLCLVCSGGLACFADLCVWLGGLRRLMYYDYLFVLLLLCFNFDVCFDWLACLLVILVVSLSLLVLRGTVCVAFCCLVVCLLVLGYRLLDSYLFRITLFAVCDCCLLGLPFA